VTHTFLEMRRVALWIGNIFIDDARKRNPFVTWAATWRSPGEPRSPFVKFLYLQGASGYQRRFRF